MNRVTAVHETTMKMLHLFERWDLEDVDRDELIAAIGPLLEEREQQIATLKEPYTEAEMALGKKMPPLNEKLEKKLTGLFEAVKIDIKKIKQKKELNYSYIKPYGDMKTTDGMYVDDKL